MAVVMVEIRPKASSKKSTVVRSRPEAGEPPGVEVVDDMDEYLEHALCSCSAGDDNPY